MGKSTTIFYLAGEEMHKFEINGLRHIDAKTPLKNPMLSSVTCSPYSRSETSCVNAVEIRTGRDEARILCDSPGFGDTRSPEIDCANSFGIMKALKSCKTIKPIFFFSYDSL